LDKPGKQTVELLRAIAKRLSSRKSCKRIEYIVCIGMIDDSIEHQKSIAEYSGGIGDVILFFPEREVFPDTHHRRSTDLIDIVSCVIMTKFKNTVFSYVDNIGQIHYQEGSVVPGIYKYILSTTKKRRKWVRVK
jgi:hypothetical protein